jgi:hypothetical protein
MVCGFYRYTAQWKNHPRGRPKTLLEFAGKANRTGSLNSGYHIHKIIRRRFPANKKSRTGSLYHLSHGQREPDGLFGGFDAIYRRPGGQAGLPIIRKNPECPPLSEQIPDHIQKPLAYHRNLRVLLELRRVVIIATA